MAIKRGGGPGGPRVPPRLPHHETPGGAQRSDGSRSAGDARAGDARAAAYDADAFEDEVSGPGVTRSASGDRAEDVFGRPEQRSSSVRNTERLLETTFDRLAREYAAVHADARAVVDQLATDRFSPAALDAAGPELREQRARMGKIRARLSNIRRRLRTIAMPAGTALDLQLQQRLGDQIRTLTDLEKGAERALMALQLATTFRPRGADGRPVQVTRVNVESAGDRHALATDLARRAPDATVTDTMLRLLTGAPSSAAGDSTRDGTSDVDALRRFAEAQLGT